MWKNWSSCTMEIQNGAASAENRMEFPEKIKNRILLLGIYPKELKSRSQRDSNTLMLKHYSQYPRCECNLHILGRWMDKENVVYTYSEILFSLKKEVNFVRCSKMYETWGPYAKWNKPSQKDKYCMILHTWGIKNRQIHRLKEWHGDSQRLEESLINRQKVLVKQEKPYRHALWHHTYSQQ